MNLSNITGKEFEDLFAEKLTAAGIPFKREGERVRRGGEIGKGKYDFELDNYVIELKVKHSLSNLSLPGMNWKKGREILYPDIKRHQIRALRESTKIGGLLICERDTQRTFWVSMKEYEAIVIKHRPRTLNGLIDHCAINLDDFVFLLRD